TADDELIEGDPANPVNPTEVGAFRTGHQFLIDVAHSASPVDDFGNPLQRFEDGDASNGPPPRGFYDGDLLDAHYMAGDGRVNENIGLTAVHAIFHSEHNRLVEQTKQNVLNALAAGDTAFASEWVRGETPAARLAAVADGIQDDEWNGERLFQVAKFG